MRLNLAQWEVWEQQARSLTGQLPTYIPRLAEVEPNAFALQMRNLKGESWTRGNPELTFPLMSVVKPLLLLFLLECLGEESVFQQVGREASELPFNSLEQLEADGGFPRNPMINSGAIALCNLLPDPECLREWLSQSANCQLFLDEAMLASVRSVPNQRNLAIAERLQQAGLLTQSPLQVLDIYEKICCLSGAIADVAQLGLLLAQPGKTREIVTEIVRQCGLYQASATFAAEVGIPTKSSVSGLLLSWVPGEGAIAIYSPPLDPAGNSIQGLFLLKQVALLEH
ncbi:glutaminase [Geitlerinema splendidum]|nr:glutaminase [Geitlerinema splendidum]